MHKNLGLLLVCGLLAAGLTGACKKQDSSWTGGVYFKTPFQSEAQYVIHAVLSDVAEQMSFAGAGKFPDSKSVVVTSTEKPRPSSAAPLFEVQVSLKPGKALKFDLEITGAIWSPAVYEAAALELAAAAGVKAVKADANTNAKLIARLLDASPETIERENQVVSGALEKNFRDPELHERAALLLGAFSLRERSGYFYDIRSPLSRMTAHLVMARVLRGGSSCGINGAMAEAILLTLIGNQAAALERLDAIASDDLAVLAMIRGLKARNTGDPRALDLVEDRSPFESIEWFSALANTLGTPAAWPKITAEQNRTVDFIRAASQLDYSVQVGHELLNNALRAEVQEISEVCRLSRGETVASNRRLVELLNAGPERCFSKGTRGQPHISVIGWGQWA